MEIIIRNFETKDAKNIYSLNKDGLGYDYNLEKVKEKLIKLSNNENYKILVAECDNQVVGYLEAHKYESLYQDSLVDMMALVVDEKYRGIGIGKKLIEGIELWAKSIDAKGLRLVTRIDRIKTHSFYEGIGFKEIKIQKNYKKFF